MKYTFTLIAMLLFSSMAYAQDFQGKAIYKSKRKIDIKLDSTQMGSEMHQKMMDMLKKQFEKTFVLSFNKNESLYKEDEKLSKPQGPSNVQVMVVNTGGADILYKNTKDNRFTNQNDVFGKIFLIKDDLEALDWKLGKETKNIGEYTCHKATLTREIEVVESNISINNDKDLDAEEEETSETKEITITAWYAPAIPVNNGPGNYHGLPGLILEVNDGTETVICSKIVLNPKHKLAIKEPTNGKKVDQKTYEAIVEKKMKQMNEQRSFNTREGQNIEIRIGG
ncbi:MAG: GLPGLI family protein [Flavobacteriaceae bacterium]